MQKHFLKGINKLNIKTAIIQINEILKHRTEHKLETNFIFQHVLKKSAAELILTDEISLKQFKKIKKIAIKLSLNRPLQHLLASWHFYGIKIKLNSKVFIPRPETEQLVDFVLKFKNEKINIIDLCSGSGCVSMAIANTNKHAHIKAIEISKDALKCAKKNTHKFKNRIQIIEGNVLNAKLAKNFKNWANIIVCNPPYLNKNDMVNLQAEIKHEPRIALYGGTDGLLFYKKICKLWKSCLKNFGWIAFEIGSTQKIEVETILTQNQFKNVKTKKDYYNNDRITIAQKFN